MKEFDPGKQRKLIAKQLADISAAFDETVAETDDYQPDLRVTISLNNGNVQKEEKPINGLA